MQNEAFTFGLYDDRTAMQSDLYFFHIDHIGSSNFVTDATGAIVSHTEYIPFGEVFVNWVKIGEYFKTTYRFTDILDCETGLYYYVSKTFKTLKVSYGAEQPRPRPDGRRRESRRYYDPAVGRFLQTDPMMDKYPGQSPYVYCANNPVKYVDPDGKDHIYYLVFENGAKGMAGIVQKAQAMLDKNGINLQVVSIEVGKGGFGDGYYQKLDKTDRMSYLGSESWLNSIDSGTIGIKEGWSNGAVGYVNTDEFSRNDNIVDMDKELARASLHEGIGHIDKEGRYQHIDTDDSGNYYPNVMNSGDGTTWSGAEENSYMFIPKDRSKIIGNIPNPTTVTCPLTVQCYDTNTSNDNFSRRLKE